MSQLFLAYTPQSHLPQPYSRFPMCQYPANNGAVTAWYMIHLDYRALSGVGMLMIEATAVELEGRITPKDLGLWNDAGEAALVPTLLRSASSQDCCAHLA